MSYLLEEILPQLRLTIPIGNQPEHAIAFEPNDRKIAAIQGEKGPNLFPLSQVSERCIRQLDVGRFIPGHQRADPGHGGRIQFQYSEQAMIKCRKKLLDRPGFFPQ